LKRKQDKRNIEEGEGFNDNPYKMDKNPNQSPFVMPNIINKNFKGFTN